jgi:hypothetical protein
MPLLQMKQQPSTKRILTEDRPSRTTFSSQREKREERVVISPEYLRALEKQVTDSKKK